ncbi:M28 family metallopeptidase [Oceanirhabdus sp. W0125-5]|uniref:M28 family metallopeptidase n=1 Tax=Oceanirhabdus sp. W0125-5 TaxID=2999116 RepID=UPI0022F2DB96|nr:M28 family metallopeptidase [Oceanirhabdus sp. W0125-5]WBW97365.1 M28 family metallopeptidase [Oceanirhabdus sp. W0125-5]
MDKKKIKLPILITIVITVMFLYIQSINVKSSIGTISLRGTEQSINKSHLEQIKIIEADLNKLTSQEFMGRLTGTRGNEKAGEYLVDRFREIGIKPFNKNQYFHEFDQEVYYPDRSEHYMKIIFKDGSEKVCEYGKDYIDQIRLSTVDLKCQVVMDKKELASRTTGEIAIVVDDDSINKNMFRSNTKAILRKRKDFFGVPQIAHRGAAYIQIDDKLYDEMFEKKAKEVIIKSRYKTNNSTVKNIIGKIPGKKKEKAFIISAHFDHVGWDGDIMFPGAIDNGSGTVAILNIAEQLVNGKELENDTYICGFNGEEFGLFGSRAFANHIKDKYSEIIVINIDCIGKINGKRLGIHGDASKNDILKKDMKSILDKKNIDNFTGTIPNSDHSSFSHDGMYSISLIQENLFKEGESIHTPKDSTELVDYEYLKKICDVVVEFIYEFQNKSYIE